MVNKQPAPGLLPAFGQRQIKGRVQHILGYKKPALGIVLLSALLVIITACAVGTDAPSAEAPPNEYQFIWPYSGEIDELFGTRDLGFHAGVDMVEQGQIISYIGNTGRADSPHLHFEVRVDGEAEDPLLYLPQVEEV